MQDTYKRRMRTSKVMLTLKTKDPKICHVLALNSAFNLKLCPMTALKNFTDGKLVVYGSYPHNLSEEVELKPGQEKRDISQSSNR